LEESIKYPPNSNSEVPINNVPINNVPINNGPINSGPINGSTNSDHTNSDHTNSDPSINGPTNTGNSHHSNSNDKVKEVCSVRRRLCKYFKRGHCNRGDSCTYLHSAPDQVRDSGNMENVRDMAGPNRHKKRRHGRPNDIVKIPKPATSLLKKLLKSEINKEHDLILACFRFFIDNHFLQSTPQPNPTNPTNANTNTNDTSEASKNNISQIGTSQCVDSRIREIDNYKFCQVNDGVTNREIDKNCTNSDGQTDIPNNCTQSGPNLESTVPNPIANLHTI